MWMFCKRVLGDRNTSLFVRRLFFTFPHKTVKCQLLHSEFCCLNIRGMTSFASQYLKTDRAFLHQNQMTLKRQNSTKVAQSKKGQLPYEVDANVTRNILIYSHKNSRFYKLMTLFGGFQLVFWSYLSLFSFRNLRDVPKEVEDKQLGIQRDDGKWYNKLMRGEGKYKNGIGVLFMSVGYLVFFITWMYPLRAVHKLILLKGGNSVQLTTYAWFGKTRSFVTPIEQVSCLQTRTSSATQIPMKVKGRWFFFLLDKKGVFHQTKLFDYTVGLKRKIN